MDIKGKFGPFAYKIYLDMKGKFGLVVYMHVNLNTDANTVLDFFFLPRALQALIVNLMLYIIYLRHIVLKLVTRLK